MPLQNIGRTIMQGAQGISNTLYNINIAKAKLKQDREELDLKKKRDKAQIDLWKKEGRISDLEADAVEAKTKAFEAILDSRKKSLESGEKKARATQKDVGTFAQGARAATVNIGGQEYESTLVEEAMGEMGFEPVEEPTDPEAFRADLQKAIAYQNAKDAGERVPAGAMTWDALKHKYPDKHNKIEGVRAEFIEPLERSPDFRMGSGWPVSRVISKFSPKQATMPPAEGTGGTTPRKSTLNVIEQIKAGGEEALQELMERREEAAGKGIDVDFILEYFGYTHKDGKLNKMGE